MSEMLERYKLEIVNNDGVRYVRCEPAPDGPWVMFRDVAALQKRVSAQRTAILKLEQDVKLIALAGLASLALLIALGVLT